MPERSFTRLDSGHHKIIERRVPVHLQPSFERIVCTRAPYAELDGARRWIVRITARPDFPFPALVLRFVITAKHESLFTAYRRALGEAEMINKYL